MIEVNNEFLAAALGYAANGYPVFPLNGKRPVMKMGDDFSNATTDQDTIQAWWTNEYKDCNIAIPTGSPSNLVVLDIDNKGAANGFASLEQLTAEIGPLPETAMQKTGSGIHYIFECNDNEIRCSVEKIAPGIDVRGGGGYIVAAPSIHPETQKPYEWIDGKSPTNSPIAPFPEALRLRLANDNSPSKRTDGDKKLEKACEKITSAADGSQNDTLNRQSFKIGRLVGGGLLDQKQAFFRLCEAGMKMQNFNTKEYWNIDQIKSIVEKALNDGAQKPNFGKESQQGKRTSDLIEDLNTSYAVTMIGSKCVVLHETFEHTLGYKKVEFLNPQDFKSFHLDKQVWNGKSYSALGDFWFKSSQHRKYDGVVFSPAREVSDHYNLWQGFAVEPTAGDCDLYLNHIRDNIASGDDQVYNYLLNFMADAIRNPDKRPGVALVMRGDQGTGKGIFVKYFGKLFGSHFKHVSSSHQLLGNFNSQLKDALIVFADEAIWAGDKAAEGRLKALVTEDRLTIEHKGKDSYQQKNFVRLLVASNNDWVVPAGASERRFCVLDVGSDKKQDIKYFRAIVQQMDNDGCEALLHFLQNRDMSGVNLRDFPKTSALMDQKIQSMDAIEKWFLDVLQRGYFNLANEKWGEPTEKWGEPIETAKVQESLSKSSSFTNQKSHVNETQLGKKLTKLVSGLKKQRITKHAQRSYVYAFPPLEECRKQFSKNTGVEIEWGTEDQASQTPSELRGISNDGIENLLQDWEVNSWKSTNRSRVTSPGFFVTKFGINAFTQQLVLFLLKDLCICGTETPLQQPSAMC